MAFTDILNYVRKEFGTGSVRPETWADYARNILGLGSAKSDRTWAENGNLGSLFQHLTFAEYPAADMGYHTRLNRTYETYKIPAWDFVNHRDQTSWLHIPHFKS